MTSWRPKRTGRGHLAVESETLAKQADGSFAQDLNGRSDAQEARKDKSVPAYCNAAWPRRRRDPFLDPNLGAIEEPRGDA